MFQIRCVFLCNSYQTLFRETSCIQKIPNLLGNLVADEWSDQKIQNSLAVLELIRILVAPKNSNSRVNQNVFDNSKILNLLISMSLELNIPHQLKSESLCALGETLRGNRSNSDKFFKQIITDKTVKLPAILYIMRLGIKGDHFSVRASAVYAFECFVYKNSDAQIGLAATLLPPPGINPNDDDSAVSESGGSLLITSLFDLDMGRKDPWSIWFATVMLSHVLLDNQEAKNLLLNKKITDDEEEPVSLLHKVVFLVLNATRQNSDVLIIIGILCLISTWLYECQGAVEEFVNEGSNIQFVCNEKSNLLAS